MRAPTDEDIQAVEDSINAVAKDLQATIQQLGGEITIEQARAEIIASIRAAKLKTN